MSSIGTLSIKISDVQAVASYADRYCSENLSAPQFQKNSLEKDWWGGIQLFLNHSFFQGRRDEVSEKVEAAAMPVLKRYFENLVAAQIGSTDFAKLGIDLALVIGKGKVGKARDVKMLVSIFQFISKLPEKNLTLYSLDKARQNHLVDHYLELQKMCQIGPKIASFYLRDLVCIYGIECLVKPDELKLLQPIDVWVRKVAHRLGIIAVETCPDDEVRTAIVQACAQYGVSAFKFNQGAWYLGKYAFSIVLEHLDAIVADLRGGSS